jgi:hypothetical protein
VIGLDVRGGEDFARLARRVKEVGDRQLRRELLSSIQRATRPVRDKVREKALSTLPSSGGLAGEVAASRFSARTSMTGRNVGVRVVGASGRDVRSLDAGRLRHPTFGHKPFVSQSVEPGFFSATIEDHAPEIRDEISDAMKTIANKIEKG